MIIINLIVIMYTTLHQNHFVQIACQVRQWKNVENRPISGKDMDKSLVSCFFDSQWISNHISMIFLHSTVKVIS